MQYDPQNRTFDCEPLLTDSQVVEFCQEGYLLLRGVVPDEINQRACDYLEGKIEANPSFIPTGMTAEDLARIRASHEPSTILLEDWFIEYVLLNAQLTGATRSLSARSASCSDDGLSRSTIALSASSAAPCKAVLMTRYPRKSKR